MLSIKKEMGGMLMNNFNDPNNLMNPTNYINGTNSSSFINRMINVSDSDNASSNNSISFNYYNNKNPLPYTLNIKKITALICSLIWGMTILLLFFF